MTQKLWNVEEKLDIVLTVLRGEVSLAELCPRHGVSETTVYAWRSQFLEAGREGLARGKSRKAPGERALEHENEELKKTVGELMMENRLLKKVERLRR